MTKLTAEEVEAALQAACPAEFCQQSPGERCVSRDGLVQYRPHAARIEAAARQVGPSSTPPPAPSANTVPTAGNPVPNQDPIAKLEGFIDMIEELASKAGKFLAEVKAERDGLRTIDDRYRRLLATYADITESGV